MAAFTHTLIDVRRGHILTHPAARRLEMIDELAQRVLSLPGPEKDTTRLPYIVMGWHEILCRFLVSRTNQSLQKALTTMRALAKHVSREDLGFDIDRNVESDLRLIEFCAGNGEVSPFL